MRSTTLIWFGFAVACATMLFHTSQRVNDGRVKITGFEERTQKEMESIRVLQAEWSYLNQPDRLEKLVHQYLHLAPMKGRQFTTLSALAAAPPPKEAKELPVVKITLSPEASAPLAAATLPVQAPEKRPAQVKSVAQKPVAPSAATRAFGDVMKGLGVE